MINLKRVTWKCDPLTNQICANLVEEYKDIGNWTAELRLATLSSKKSNLQYFSLNLGMSTMRIEILNPKAAKLLKDLADLDLISIQDTSKNGFKSVLKKLRSKVKSAPNLEEITKEVELVRSRRYEKKG